jgi:tetratricopeptide (TPR) repeat protein
MSAQPSGIKTRLAECFVRAQQLTAANNYDYAHTLFAECVVHDPPNLAYVEALLHNLRRKVPQPPKKLFGGGSSRELKRALSHQQWSQVLRSALDHLRINPWDVATLRALAELSAKLHHNEVELAYLKQALDAAPRDLEVNRHCARSLARMGQFDQAIACWHRIEIIRSGDKEAAKMIAQLAEEKLKFADGHPPTATIPPVPVTANSDSIHDVGIAIADIPTSNRLRLERAIADDPYDISNYLQLADLFLESNDLRDAEAILKQGIETCRSHSALTTRLEHVLGLRAQDEAELERMRRKDIARHKEPFRMPWLEAGLLLAGVVLVLQMFPTVGAATLRGVDFRGWSQGNWIYATCAVIVALFLIRLSPTGLFSKWFYRVAWLVPAVLFLQIIPPVRAATWRIVDIRQWSQGNWLAGIVLILVTSSAIRFGAEILHPLLSRPRPVRKLRRSKAPRKR